MAQKIMRWMFALAILFGVFSGCTTDPLEVGPNGDSRLREISFLDKPLYPDFNPIHHEYYINENGQERVIGFMKTFMFHTKFTLNGYTVKMQTNMYKLPDMTDLTAYFTNDDGIAGVLGKDRFCAVKVTAQDGNVRDYLITLKGPSADARIKSITAVDSNRIIRFLKTFEDYCGPYYTANGLPGADIIEFSVDSVSTAIKLEMVSPGAKVFLDVGPGSPSEPEYEERTAEADGTVNITLSGVQETGSTCRIKVESADGTTTNYKTFRVYYYDPDKDARILDMHVFTPDGQEVGFLPHFTYKGAFTWSTNRRANLVNTGDAIKYPTVIEEAMLVLLDNEDTVTIRGVRLASDTTLSFRAGNYATPFNSNTNASAQITNSQISAPGETAMSIPWSNNGDGSFEIRDLKVTQGMRLRINAYKGGTTISYLFEFRLVSEKAYGFDGGIMNLNRLIYQLTDTTGKGIHTTIMGILTMLNVYPDNISREGWFMEDGGYGLYVWSYNGYPSAGSPGTIQVGHKISTEVTEAKIWQNMPEVTNSKDTKVVENNIRYPLHYINANRTDFSGTRNLARIMRYSTFEEGQPISGTYDQNGVGALNMVKDFKFQIPYTKSVESALKPTMAYNWYQYSADIRRTEKDSPTAEKIIITHATEYMLKGQHGIFYGPLFTDSEGTAMIVKDKHYMNIPPEP